MNVNKINVIDGVMSTWIELNCGFVSTDGSRKMKGHAAGFLLLSTARIMNNDFLPFVVCIASQTACDNSSIKIRQLIECKLDC